MRLLSGVSMKHLRQSLMSTLRKCTSILSRENGENEYQEIGNERIKANQEARNAAQSHVPS
jgi:hypothetical protein